MWWYTGVAMASALILTGVALLPWARQFQPESQLLFEPVCFRDHLRSRRLLAAFTASLDLATLVLVGANFLSENKLSRGLAANYAFGIAVASGVTVCLVRGWKNFRKPEWKVFRQSFLVTLGVLWATFAIVVAVLPQREDEPSGILFGVLLATFFAPLWVPFIGVPIAVFASYFTIALKRRRVPAPA